MSERKTKRLSGYQYRQNKKQKMEEQQKLSGALEKFLSVPVRAETGASQEDAITLDSANIFPTTSATLPTQHKGETGIDSKEGSPNLDTQEKKPEEVSTLGESIYSNDPGKWPYVISTKDTEFLVENFPFQVRNINFPKDAQKRKFSEAYYYRKLDNGEKIHRQWLLYSVSLDSVFCGACKIFEWHTLEKSEHHLAATRGVNDWRYLSILLKKHECSLSHITNIKKLTELQSALKRGTAINSSELRLYELEKAHWYGVIERLLSIVKFLSKQCLAFRGSTEKLFAPNNGNFLQLAQLISHFDPVLSEHIRRVQTSKQGSMPHYLGMQIQNEMILLLAEAIRSEILERARCSKYFSIILDCTPDITHTEQITVVIRFVSSAAPVVIYEHFLCFCPVTDTTGKELFDFLINKFKELNLDLNNLRGQGYDNGANMRGKHIGLQKRILDVCPRASYVPCSAHSLNLVVNDAVKVSFESMDFFNLVQELFVYFSSS